MPDTKISNLPAATAATGTELVPVVQSASTRRMMAAAIAASGNPKAHTHTTADISDATADGRTIVTGTQAQRTALLDTFTGAAKGLVPAYGTASGRVLTDGGWATGGTGGSLDLEAMQDAVAAMVLVGAGLSKTYDDTAGTLLLQNTESASSLGAAP